MSSNTRELEREVEQHRSEMLGTVEALRQKLTPGQLVDDFTDYLRQSNGGNMARNFGAQVRDNPLPLALIGAGVAWLMYGRGTRHRSRHGDGQLPATVPPDPYAHTELGLEQENELYRDMLTDSSDEDEAGTSRKPSSVGAMASRTSDAARQVGQSASSAARSAGEAAGSAASAIRRSASAAGEMAGSLQGRPSRAVASAGSAAADYGRRATRKVSSAFMEEPLVFGALTVAVSAAVAAMLPSTDVEDRNVGPLRNKALGNAKEAAAEGFAEVRRAAASAYEGAKEEAQRQGLVKEGNETLAEKADETVRAGVRAAKSETADS